MQIYRFDRSRYSRDYKKPLPIGKDKMVISMMKDERSGKSLLS